MTVSIQEYKERLKNKGLNFRVLGEWGGMNVIIEHQCRKCKHTWSIKPHWTRDMLGCPKCTGRNKNKTTADYRKELRTLNPSVRVLGEYLTAHTRLKHQCRECHHVWDAFPMNIRNGTICPKCSYKNRVIKRMGTVTKNLSRKKYRIHGKSFLLQGYEAAAVYWIHEHENIPITKIRSTKLPLFDYTFKDKGSVYLPDLIIKDETIVEVKGLYTAGLLESGGLVYNETQEDTWERIKVKAKSVLEAGYKFKLLVMDLNGKRIRLPNNWIKLSCKDTKQEIAK
jgi:hypothetical protein